MELRTGKSIWDDMPEGWGEQENIKTEDSSNSGKSDEVERSIPSDDIPAESQPQNSRVAVEDKKDSYGNEPVVPVPSEKKQKKSDKKLEKKKCIEFEKRNKENKINSSDNTKKAYEKEQKENRHDFMILGIAISAIIIGIVIFVLVFTRTSTQHIYDLINQGNYSIAYQEIGELYEKNKNVDSVVYDFAEQCARNSEYKRAVASLDYLSEDAEDNKEFFDTLIGTMLSHGKTNRAYEVFEYMLSHGDILNQYAVELYDKYEENF